MESDKFSPEFLESHRISELPSSFYYIPNFITAEEEESLMSKIYDSKAKWQNLSHRRLQVHPTALTPSNVLLLNPQPASKNSTPTNPLPLWLTQPIHPKLHSLGLFTDPTTNPRISAPNHCLINEYQPSQGIMPHEDGAAYRPIVATVSLGSHTVLDLHDKPGSSSSTAGENQRSEDESAPQNSAGLAAAPRWRILQERRSLLVTVGEAYACCLHGIAHVAVDRGLRPFQRGQRIVSDDATAAGRNGDVDECEEDCVHNEDGGGIVNWRYLADSSPFESGECARDTRVSLTFRDVVKVKDVSRALFGTKR